jgi:hypothetical protein
VRRIDSVPRWAYPFAALLLIASCLMIGPLPRSTGAHVQSAKTLLQTIPLYPGAIILSRDDTDTPGGKINHQDTFCHIECARVIYEAQDQSEEVRIFYEIWARRSNWQVWGSTPPEYSYIYGPRSVIRWHVIEPGWPIFTAEYETKRDYMLDIKMREKGQRVTTVELIVHRFAPIPSDTPIPTLPPPPPTAVILVAPGSVRTQQPPVPAPIPTAP